MNECSSLQRGPYFSPACMLRCKNWNHAANWGLAAHYNDHAAPEAKLWAWQRSQGGVEFPTGGDRAGLPGAAARERLAGRCLPGSADLVRIQGRRS